MSCNNCNKKCNCQTYSNPVCSCPVKDLSTDCVLYTGETLVCSNIETNTLLTDVLKKIDTKLCDSNSSVTNASISVTGDLLKTITITDSEGNSVTNTFNDEGLRSVVEGKDISIDNTDPLNPIVSVEIDDSFVSQAIRPTNEDGTLVFDIQNGDGILIYKGIGIAIIRVKYNQISIVGGATVNKVRVPLASLPINIPTGEFVGGLSDGSQFPGSSINDLVLKYASGFLEIKRTDSTPIIIPDTATPARIVGSIVVPIT